MITKKYYTKCKLCGKEINITSGNAVFDRHLSTHNNPIGRNCNQWYKDYFKRDKHTCVCKLCDKEFYHDNLYSWSSEQYVKHLKNEHSITKN